MKIKIEAIEKYLPSKKVASFELDDKCKAPRGRIEKTLALPIDIMQMLRKRFVKWAQMLSKRPWQKLIYNQYI